MSSSLDHQSTVSALTTLGDVMILHYADGRAGGKWSVIISLLVWLRRTSAEKSGLQFIAGGGELDLFVQVGVSEGSADQRRSNQPLPHTRE